MTGSMLVRWTVVGMISLLAGCAANRTTTNALETTSASIAPSGMTEALRVEPGDEKPREWSGSSYTRNGFKYLMPVYVALGEPEWYCSCDVPLVTAAGAGAVDISTCDLGYIESQERATTLSWEHVVPQSWLSNADAPAESINAATGDPYNLIPSVMPLNGIRSNWPYWEIDGEDNVWETSGGRFEGSCDFEVLSVGGVTWIEPPDEYKGDLARITLYMRGRYGFEPTQVFDVEQYLELMKLWSELDPVSEIEQRRLELIARKVDWAESPLDHER